MENTASATTKHAQPKKKPKKHPVFLQLESSPSCSQPTSYHWFIYSKLVCRGSIAFFKSQVNRLSREELNNGQMSRIYLKMWTVTTSTWSSLKHSWSVILVNESKLRRDEKLMLVGLKNPQWLSHFSLNRKRQRWKRLLNQVATYTILLTSCGSANHRFSPPISFFRSFWLLFESLSRISCSSLVQTSNGIERCLKVKIGFLLS